MLNEIYQNIDPVAFTIGSFTVRWYGLAYIAGFICVGVMMPLIARRWKVKLEIDSVLIIMICAMFGVIVGARLGYCLFYGNGFYLYNPAKILAFTEGGMSFHGGLVGALLGGFVASKIVKTSFLRLADIVVIGAPLGLLFGRCANFINGELWGAHTDLPWGVCFGGAAGMAPRHPSQLYEALLEGLVLFIIMFAMSRRLPPYKKGTYFAVFLILYGVFRFLVEFVRQPDSQLGYIAWNWLTMGQLLSVPLILLGATILVWNATHKEDKEKETSGESNNLFTADSENAANLNNPNNPNNLQDNLESQQEKLQKKTENQQGVQQEDIKNQQVTLQNDQQSDMQEIKTTEVDKNSSSG